MPHRVLAVPELHHAPGTSRRDTFLSWGRYPRYDSTLVPLFWPTDYPAVVAAHHGMPTGALAVGMGRSTGDSCLLRDGNLLLTTGMNRLLRFDPDTGVLTAEAGLTLANLLDFAVPRGWFLPVSPGTKHVTLGGAVANDVHGKNQHLVGTFGRHVLQFELVRSDGERLHCSPTSNPDWFAATIGGLGLTGVLTWVQLRLAAIGSRLIDYESIRFHGIDEFLTLSDRYRQVQYTGAWIDCTATGKHFARGIFSLGDHSRIPETLRPSSRSKRSLPFHAPGLLTNRSTVRLLNAAYFHRHHARRVRALQDFEPLLYPFDRLLHWNRMYGKAGPLQFQCVLPWSSAREGIVAILQEVIRSGLASIFAMLKVFGDLPSPGLVSFPQPGLSLSLDLPLKAGKSFALFDRLTALTLDFGGRLYPAKDARMSAAAFQTGYPQWQQLARFKDPLLTSSFWERVTAS